MSTATELVVRQLGDFVHLGSRWAPWVVRSGIADLCLRIRVTFGVVLGDSKGAFPEVLHL